MFTCTKRIEFDFGHRLIAHETKCANLHGHRAFVDVTCGNSTLDKVGRVIDFGTIKSVFGSWIDENLDHTMILNSSDDKVIEVVRATNKKPPFIVPFEPSSEHLADFLYHKGNELLKPHHVRVVQIRFYETPNSWSDYPNFVVGPSHQELEGLVRR